VNSPWHQDGQRPVACVQRFLDDGTIIRRSWNDGDAIAVRRQLTDALFSANTDHLIISIQRMLDHVLSQLTGCTDYAHFLYQNNLQQVCSR